MAIDSSDDLINPRDVDVEADEYESSISLKQDEIDDIEMQIQDLDDEDESYDDDLADLECQLENLKDELTGLEEEAEDIFELRDDCNMYARGESLINEDYWVQYVQQMAEDIDGIDTSNWPYDHINWDDAAEAIRADYTTISWRGQDFYVRS